MRTVAENRSELDDRLGKAFSQKPGSRRSQRVFYEWTFDGEQTRDVVLGTCTCTRVQLEYRFQVLVLVLVIEG